MDIDYGYGSSDDTGLTSISPLALNKQLTPDTWEYNLAIGKNPIIPGVGDRNVEGSTHGTDSNFLGDWWNGLGKKGHMKGYEAGQLGLGALGLGLNVYDTFWGTGGKLREQDLKSKRLAYNYDKQRIGDYTRHMDAMKQSGLKD